MLKHIQINAYGKDYAICGLTTDSWRRKVKFLDLHNIDVITGDLRKNGLSFGYMDLEEAKEYFKGKVCLNCVKVAVAWGYLRNP